MSSRCLSKSLGPFFEGPQLLLTSPEDIEVASIVYDLSLEEISRSPSEQNVVGSDDDDPRIEVSKRNLKRILKLFESASQAREQFVGKFKLWEALRLENLRQLKDLVRLMREEKKKCGIGLLAGGAVSLVGGAAIAGALLFPPAAPALIPAAISAYIPAALLPAATAAAASLPSFLLPAAAAAPAAASGALAGGIAAAGVGGAAVAGSAVALVALLEKRAEEARKVVEDDQRAFEMCLDEWFRHTQGLVDAVEELVKFDVIESWVEDLNAVLSWSKDKNSLLLGRKDLFAAGIKLCIVRLLPSLGGGVLAGFSAAFLASLLTFLFSLFWLKRRSLFRLVYRTWSLVRDRLLSLDPRRLMEAVGSVAAVGQMTFLLTRRGDAFGVLGLVGSVAAVVLASLDLKEGRCNGADAVEKVVEKLQEELDILEEVYRSLVSREEVTSQKGKKSYQTSKEVVETLFYE